MSDSSATREQHSSSIRDSPPAADPARNPGPDPEPEPTSESTDGRRVLERTVPVLAPSIRKAGFWGAIVLPFCYVPLLLIGLSTPLQTLAFFGLVAINLLALYVGHSHRR